MLFIDYTVNLLVTVLTDVLSTQLAHEYLIHTLLGSLEECQSVM
jgi:hypothetical protein